MLDTRSGRVYDCRGPWEPPKIRSVHRSVSFAGLLAALLIALSACGARTAEPATATGAPDPSAAVERFLRLAGEEDYVAMGWVFGTQEGPIIRRDPRPDVERRMYALASVLRHEEFSLIRERQLPGRIGRAVQVLARLQAGERVHEVPFVAVLGPRNRWYVEQVDLEVVTGQRR